MPLLSLTQLIDGLPLSFLLLPCVPLSKDAVPSCLDFIADHLPIFISQYLGFCCHQVVKKSNNSVIYENESLAHNLLINPFNYIRDLNKHY